MPIHTLLSANSYRLTADSGIEIDPDTSIVTRRQTAVFRGTLAALYNTFQFGTQSESPDGQSRLYCSGPRGVRQVPGTSEDPHWEFDAEWIGLHSYIHSPGTQAFWRVSPFWGVRETQLPLEVSGGGGTIVAIPPYLPASANVWSPVNIHDYLPGVNVRGVMYTNQHPHPAHPFITALKATLPSIVTPSMITANTINYSALAAAGFNYCKGIPAGSATSNNTVGAWFVGDISAESIIEPMDGSTANKIYLVNFPVRWLPRKVPA